MSEKYLAGVLDAILNSAFESKKSSKYALAEKALKDYQDRLEVSEESKVIILKGVNEMEDEISQCYEYVEKLVIDQDEQVETDVSEKSLEKSVD